MVWICMCMDAPIMYYGMDMNMYDMMCPINVLWYGYAYVWYDAPLMYYGMDMHMYGCPITYYGMPPLMYYGMDMHMHDMMPP